MVDIGGGVGVWINTVTVTEGGCRREKAEKRRVVEVQYRRMGERRGILRTLAW